MIYRQKQSLFAKQLLIQKIVSFYFFYRNIKTQTKYLFNSYIVI
ncbi:hypothetical protein C8C85_1485 [Flavobacterium sp. 103]|nr:hypothetical protein C8C85_1485 [Flavobacterium sp. 103]